MYIKPFPWPSDMPFKQLDPSNIKYLVVHHSESGDASAETIDQWHKGFGWLGLGYHAIIRQDGSIEGGRPEWAQGAHCLGHNHHSLGVCVTGDFTKNEPTERQLDALGELLRFWKGNSPEAEIKPHRDLSATQCPGWLFPWGDLMKRMEGGDMPEQWKIDIINQAKEAGLIPEDFNPDEKVQVWFVLATELNLLKKILKEA